MSSRGYNRLEVEPAVRRLGVEQARGKIVHRCWLRGCEKVPANHTNDTNKGIPIRVIRVIRGQKSSSTPLFHSLSEFDDS